MALYLVMSYNSGANTISLDLEIKIYYNFLEHFFTGLCQQDQQEIHGLGDRLPFRQLGPVSYPNAVNDKTEKKSGTGLQSNNSPLGSRSNGMHTGPKHLDEPELLTSSQDIEVVLGDTTVLPCKVAHLGIHVLVCKGRSKI